MAGPRLTADLALMRVVDVGLAFPFLLLVMAIGAALEHTTVTTILVTLGLTGWLGVARILRAKTLQVQKPRLRRGVARARAVDPVDSRASRPAERRGAPRS